MRLSAHGITAELPAGWEGRITRRRRPAATSPTGASATGPTAAARAGAIGSPDEVPEPVVHLANFALPEDRGDFGSGAVDLMRLGPRVREPVRVRPRERRPGARSRSQGIPTLRPRMFAAPPSRRPSPARPAASASSPTTAGPSACTSCSGSRRTRPPSCRQANGVLRATTIEPR